MRVLISINEPWDLGEAVAWRAIQGEILRSEDDDQGGRVLIRLDQPFDHRGASYRYLVMSPRNQGDRVDLVHTGSGFYGVFIGITDQQAGSTNPLDTSAWRGGLGFEGTVVACRVN